MNKSNILFRLLCLLSVVIMGFAQHALAKGEQAFTVDAGEVVITPARCPPDSCVITRAKISGKFSASFARDNMRIYFPRSDLSTSPDVSFQLPLDPMLDEGGTVRDIGFEFDGTQLDFKGSVDSRAFDGPLIEYKISATVSEMEFSARGFFTARPDLRKCVSPLCGGYWVKKVNRRMTRCADGTIQRECYVASIQWPGSEFGPVIQHNAPLLLKGKIIPREYPNFGNLGAFIAKAAYRPASTNVPRGRFYGIQNNGIVCITSPCFSFDQYLLNSRRQQTISSFDLSRAGAGEKEIDMAMKILANGGVLLGSGKNVREKGLAGVGRKFLASQFYLPLRR